MRDINKFKGCLIGGAVGDALGYAVEFLPASSIFHRYGKRGIREYELKNGKAEFSDDTQMTLFTAMGLLSGSTNGAENYTDYIAAGYIDWYKTQTRHYPLKNGEGSSWLVNVPEMFSGRAPGSTCMSALSQGGRGTMEAPLNNSKGCGGIMRVSPIGLYFNDSGRKIEEIDILGAKAAALTHGHELGYIPSAMLVHIIQRITEYGDNILEAAEDSVKTMPLIFPKSEYMDDLLALIKKAMELSGSGTDDLEAIRQLGEGWVAEETLAIALYCALKYSGSFEGGVIAAVNHDGDSDSTGAVAGNILGAYLGFDAVPEKYVKPLELSNIIIETAEDLYKGLSISENKEFDKIWKSKYVDMTYKL